MRFLFAAGLLILSTNSFAAEKVQKRTPSSSMGVLCMTINSLEVSKGRYIINDNFELQYSTPMGLTLGLATINTALTTNSANDLCINADQESLNDKKVRADWPSLSIKPRRISVNN